MCARPRSLAAFTLTVGLLLSSLLILGAARRACAPPRSHAARDGGQAAACRGERGGQAAIRETVPEGGNSLTTPAGTPLPEQPTPVLAGLNSASDQGYRDREGRFHSGLAPYSVSSHWVPSQVGGPAHPNDRFTAPDAPQRYIDVLAEPNNLNVDTAHLQSELWSYLRDMSLQPVVIGRVRVLGAWLPIIRVTNPDTGQPQAEIVFATTHDIWMVVLTTMADTWSRDVHELTAMAGTFRLEHISP